MTVITGISGAVGSRETIRNWSITHVANLQEYAASNTRKARSAVLGTQDWNGSFSGYGSLPELLPGDTGTFQGSMDGVKGATGSIIVDSVEITCPIEEGKPIEYTCSFSGNGALTVGADTSADTSLLIPATGVGCKASLGTLVASPVWTDLDDLRSWKLKLAMSNKEYASSSTSGWKKRAKGQLTVEVTLPVYTNDYSALPQPGDIKAVRLYDAAATYWEIKWLIFGDMSEIGASPEEANLIVATLNGKYRALATVDAAVAAGSITKPGGAAWTW